MTSVPGRTHPSLGDVTSEEWDRLKCRRVFFGHQSVGDDIIAGVADLLAEHPALGLRVIESADGGGMTVPALYHARIGRNEVPQSKIEAFARLASGPVSDGGIAAFKFCYVDVTATTDPAALFDSYRHATATLRSAHPRLTVLHMTMPLQADWGTYFHWKRVIRGRLTTHRELNAVRQAYNERVRATYDGKEPLLDLAFLESLGASGEVCSVRFRSRRVPVLAREWTTDGGHLNPAGRKRVAEAFLVALAQAPEQ